jgi:hypothetical protein
LQVDAVDDSFVAETFNHSTDVDDEITHANYSAGVTLTG